MLAVPWSAALETLPLVADDGVVLVDVTNPFEPQRSRSGAEELQAAAPQARVVKAWDHLYSQVIRRGIFDGAGATVFVAGDDAGAKELVAGLVRDAGFEPADAGPLASARFLEPLAALMTTLDLARGEENPILAPPSRISPSSGR